MQDNGLNMNSVFSTPQPSENRNCVGNGNSFGCGSGNCEILFFIIIFLLLFTNFGCCGR